MLNKILRDLRYILSNDSGWFMLVAAAVAAVSSLASANSERNDAMSQKAKDAQLQRARNERARVSNTESLVENSQIAREATQRREIAIESNRITAESSLDETFAGSGISGTSVNELDQELEMAVVQNKQDNIDALDSQLSKISKEYRGRTEDINLSSEQIDTKAPKRNVLGEVANAASSAASVYGSSGLSKTGAKVEGFFKGSTSKAASVGNNSRLSSSISGSLRI